MNWHETETRAQIMLSLAIMVCVLVGTYIVFSMSRREGELLRQVKALSILNELQAKQAHGLSILNDIQTRITKQQSQIVENQSNTVRDQEETNRYLSREIIEIRRRQNILDRIAERIGVAVGDNKELKKP